MMDFASFAAVEWYHTFESERALERRAQRWLRRWRDLMRAGKLRGASVEAEPTTPELKI